MLVQHNGTHRELEMFWIEVADWLTPETERILKRWTKAKDEDYKRLDDGRAVRYRVVATGKHHARILYELAKGGMLDRYENSF